MSSFSDFSVHDDLLFSMLKECKTLPIFLDNIFGFLSRRTDFYCVATDPNSPVGLPPGLAEQTVKKTFYKWKSNYNDAPPKAAKEIEVSTETKLQPSSPKPSQFTSSDSYNGATFENYSWSQSLLEIDIVVNLPKNSKSKDLLVKILCDKISIKLKSGEVLLEGDLCEKCKHNDAIWSLHETKLSVHLDKCKELWWNCLVKSEPKLDVAKLDCSRPYEELPEEAQAKIEELQWNQERKRQGLPTSDQMQMHSVLRDAWNAEGSPFKGPYDPSTVKLN